MDFAIVIILAAIFLMGVLESIGISDKLDRIIEELEKLNGTRKPHYRDEDEINCPKCGHGLVWGETDQPSDIGKCYKCKTYWQNRNTKEEPVLGRVGGWK
jgi:hypothetical protein